MRPLRLLIPSLAITVLLAAWFLPQAVRFAPLIHAEARAALAQSLDTLNARGVWLVNASVSSIENHDGFTCVRWAHRYRGRTLSLSSTSITTCP